MKSLTPCIAALAGSFAFVAAPAQAQAVSVAMALAQAHEETACRKLRFADAGRSDTGATTGLVLQALGVQPSVAPAPVPVTPGRACAQAGSEGPGAARTPTALPGSSPGM